MSESLLAQLRTMTVVVADSGDLNAIEQFLPRDTTTNPSLIAQAAAMPAYAALVDDALRYAKAEHPSRIVSAAIDRLAVEFGLRILKMIPGRVSTEVDARLSFSTDQTIAKARELIAQYEKAGVARGRILIKIASTWEGIEAARQLELENVHCNLTLLFGMHQAVACANAKVTLISPFVGRILDWYKKSTGRASYAPSEDPGVVSVTAIYNYYKKHGHKTEVMGASFRNIGEITELAGCDLLTIAPALLSELEKTEAALPRKLDASHAKTLDLPEITMNETLFRAAHEADAMSRDKLSEGIEGFTKALVSLEAQLEARLQTL
jgi:transaldolase